MGSSSSTANVSTKVKSLIYIIERGNLSEERELYYFCEITKISETISDR